MKILIICACLEEGKDGIGDYSRKLAQSFIKAGHQTFLIALNDGHIDHTIETNKLCRIPKHIDWKQKVEQAKRIVSNFQPDFISLQLVAFGFHPKGILRKIIAPLKAMVEKLPVHLMLHELWLGDEKGANLKRKVWGFLIRRYVLKLIQELAPKVIYVNSDVYRFVLRRYKVEATTMPVFSNVDVCDTAISEQLISTLTPEAFDKIDELRKNYFIAGFFGIIHPEWESSEVMNALEKLTQTINKKLLVLFIGKISNEAIEKRSAELPVGSINFVTGLCPSTTLSQYISLCDVGITSNPDLLISKSGTVASFWTHGKPAIVSRLTTEVEGFVSTTFNNPLALPVKEIANYFTKTGGFTPTSTNFTSDAVADTMLKDMGI